MAMVGKIFQRTISMSQIGPGSSLHAEKAQAQNYYQQQEGEVGEQPPAKQWEILKNAEAMMMMMMGGSTTSEEGPERQTMLNTAAAAANKNEPAQHPHTGVYPSSPATSCAVSTPEHHMMSSPAALILPTHHFLDACFYCKRRLRPERDIFIYRGDAAFCTEECRHRQILNEEIHS